MTITGQSSLAKDDIERMVKDAEAHADEDKKRKELVEARNQGEALAHSTEKSLKDYGDKVSAEDKGAIETAIAELKTALEGEDLEAIQAKTQALSEVSMKLGEAMYKAAQAEEEAGASAEGAEDAPKADDDVVDADFEEVSDDDDKNDKKSA